MSYCHWYHIGKYSVLLSIVLLLLLLLFLTATVTTSFPMHGVKKVLSYRILRKIHPDYTIDTAMMGTSLSTTDLFATLIVYLTAFSALTSL